MGAIRLFFQRPGAGDREAGKKKGPGEPGPRFTPCALDQGRAT